MPSRDPKAVQMGLKSNSWIVSDDLSTITFPEESLQSKFYNGCSDDDATWAKSMLVPQPTGSLMDPMQTTEQNFGRAPKVYIECLQDGAIWLPYQREMQANLPCGRTITMDTGHSPFLSAPEELARHLVSV